jgi:hypothetical protein
MLATFISHSYLPDQVLETVGGRDNCSFNIYNRFHRVMQVPDKLELAARVSLLQHPRSDMLAL